MSLAGRSILVTGASSGLGRAIAQTLADQGARVMLIARNAERLESTRASLTGDGHIAVALELAQPDLIAPKLRELTAAHGPLHGLVHCAGLMLLRPLRLLGAEDWDRVMKLNVVAASALAKGFRQKGVCAEGGSIVFLASITGLVGQSAQSLYGASKGALIAMTRALAVELAREKIRVNCVAPAVVETGMSEQLRSGMSPEQWASLAALHPLGLGRPEDVAHAVNFLLADTGRWITGTTLVVDGGYTAQ